MYKLCLVLVLGLAAAPRILAITNGDATASPSKRPVSDSAVLTPEELLHGVVPCTCIDIRLCPSLLNSLKHPISASSTELKHLQRFTCGFKGFTPFVCCNEMANTPMVDVPQPTRPFDPALTPTRNTPSSTPDFFSSSFGTFSPTGQHGETHTISSVANPYDGNSKSSYTSETMFYDSSTIGGDKTGFHPTESATQIVSDPIASKSTLYNSISSTHAPNNNPTDGISATFGAGFTRDTSPDVYSIPTQHVAENSNTTPKSLEKDVHKFTNGETNTFSITPVINAEVPVTPGPPRNANDVANEDKFKENPYKGYETSTDAPSSLHTLTSSPLSVYVTSSSNDRTYDPTQDIAAIFGNGSQHTPIAETSTPKIHIVSYDPTDDIRATFGASPNEGSQQPDLKPNTHTVETRRPTSTSQVLTPGYDKVTKIPEITVTYNVLVKNTNIEKKYLDFFNMFYKNHLDKPAQGKPIQTPNRFGSQVDSTLPQISPLNSIQLNSFSGFDKDIRDGKQVAGDNQYYNYETIQKPRPSSTNRYIRQYNPDFYFDNRFAPHYFTRHLSSSPNYDYYQPSNRPRYNNNRRTTIYANIHKAQTQPPDSWLYNDYNPASDSESVPSSKIETQPQSAYQQYNSYQHNMRNRGTQFNRDIGRARPRTRKPAPTNDGSITFPNEDDDDRKPFGQYNPNVDSSHYPGPFFNENPNRRPYPNNPHQPIRKPNPYNPHRPWGYNHPNHYPDYYEGEPEPEPGAPVSNQPFTDAPKPPRKPPSKPAVLASTVSAASPPAPAPAPTTAPTTTTTTATSTAPPVVAPVVVPASVNPAPSEVVTQVTPPAVAPDLEAKRQLLPRDECGVSVEERIVGGKTATLGAYPWIARIGYLRPGSDRVLYRCAGTLINNLYIITAAHCVTNLPGGLVLSTIRLGELDDTTDPDCVNEECADPVQNYSPAQITVHQTYDKPQFKNDVGLVRLDRAVNITTYVSPICLPFDILRSKNYMGLKAIVAGWGASNVGTSSATPVLQWVSLTVAPMAQCVTTFATRTGVQVGPGQLCAGGEQGRDSCEGDSGGPLMRPEQPDADSLPRYFLIGIVSFGAKRCGSDNMPGVYTDVAFYLDWILTTIQP